MRGGLAFVVVAALSAVSVTWLLDSIADDGPVSAGLERVAKVEAPATPGAPVVVTQAEQPAIASITPPMPEELIAAAPAEPAEEVEEVQGTDEARNADVVEVAEEPKPRTADSIVAPAAPPPQAATDDEATGTEVEPAEAGEPTRVVAAKPEAHEEQREAQATLDSDAATAPEAKLTAADAEETPEASLQASSFQAAELESEGTPSGTEADSTDVRAASEALQEQAFEVAALEEPSPEVRPEVEAATEEPVAETPSTSENIDVGRAVSEPAVLAPDVVELEDPSPEAAKPEVAALIEEEVTGPPQSDPIEPAVVPQAIEEASEKTAKPVEPDVQDEALVALAADLMPHALPQVEAASTVDSPERLVEMAAETEGPTNGEALQSDLPTAAKKALAEVDALAEEVEKVLVEPVRLSELLPSEALDKIERAAPADPVLPIDAATPTESLAPLEPQPTVEDVTPLDPQDTTNELVEEAEQVEPDVELVEASPEPSAEEPPSILTEPDLADSIPSEPLPSEAATQVASLAPTKRPDAAQEETPIPLPVRRPGQQVASLTATPGAAVLNGKAPWQQNAVPINLEHGAAPMIALVIDDLGLNRPKTWRTIELPAPLTLAFLTYATNLSEMTASARARGHELIVHMPMEPLNPRENPGRNALVTEETSERMASRLDWGLSRFEGYVGINNHMGSRFTAWTGGMEVVMREMRRRGLLFLDSLTTYESVGSTLAERFDVPYAVRDIFLDNEAEDAGAIRRQLEKLEEVALEKGYAVGIGHPYPVTLDVLTEWLPGVQERGFRLVPISAVVRHRSELAAKAE